MLDLQKEYDSLNNSKLQDLKIEQQFNTFMKIFSNILKNMLQ